MNIIRIPSKLKVALSTLRSGQIELGLEQLDKIKGFEPQKSIAKAEINYFISNYEEALYFDELALPFSDQWYAGNILFEHLHAYSTTAILSNNSERAQNFLKRYLGEKEVLGLPDHILNTYRHQVTQHLNKLSNREDTVDNHKSLCLIEQGRTREEFITQLKEYRPKFTYDSVEGAEYLLHFMFEQGNTAEALEYYNRHSDKIRLEHHHINAARLYLKINSIENAKKAIMTYTINSWYPVEHIQVTPMRLWEYKDIRPIFTKELREEILLTPKAKQAIL
jgi:hypothetical protein